LRIKNKPRLLEVRNSQFSAYAFAIVHAVILFLKSFARAKPSADIKKVAGDKVFLVVASANQESRTCFAMMRRKGAVGRRVEALEGKDYAIFSNWTRMGFSRVLVAEHCIEIR
jgi:hypothetical protein